MPSNRITPDEAFTEAYRSHRLLVYGDDPSTLPAPLSASPSGGKKRKRQQEEAAEEAGAGGFFTDGADDNAGGGGGGFLVDDQNVNNDDAASQSANADGASSTGDQPKHLPISEIPHALTLLNLPNDDPSILSVFENGAVDDPLGQVATSAGAAVSGGSRRRGAAAGGGVIKVISRDDFKQVCEILLEDDGSESVQEEEEQSEVEEPQQGRRRRSGRAAAQNLRVDHAADEDDDDDDVYQESSDEDEEDDDDEDFAQDTGRRRRGRASTSKPSSALKSRPQPSRRRRRKVSSSSSSSGSESDSEVRLTSSQRSQITDLWSMFTDKLDEVDPTWRSSSTDARPRLTERELQRLAIVIGEKVSEKDVAEMLSLANSSFAPMSSKNATRQGARAAREAAAKKRGAEEGGVGIDEFAGILIRGRMV